MVEKFIDFLKRENAFDSYVANFGEHRKGYMIEWLNVKEPDDFLDCAFLWSETLEGWEYWGSLNKKWLKEVQK